MEKSENLLVIKVRSISLYAVQILPFSSQEKGQGDEFKMEMNWKDAIWWQQRSTKCFEVADYIYNWYTSKVRILQYYDLPGLQEISLYDLEGLHASNAE